MNANKPLYVDNEDFLARMLEFREKRKIDSKYRIPEKIGEYILLIARGVATHSKFSKFMPIRDTMVSQAVENCIRYIDNWNPQYGKPFNYFTTIAFYACMKTIGEEKFQFKIKHEAARRTGNYQLIEQALSQGIDNAESIEENIYGEFSGRIEMDREMTFGVKEEWPAEIPMPNTRRGKKKKPEEVVDLDVDSEVTNLETDIETELE